MQPIWGNLKNQRVYFSFLGLPTAYSRLYFQYLQFSIAISSVHTSNIYLDANTKDIDTKFSRNLENTSKKTF